MTRKPTATGTRTRTETIDVVFNGHSGDLCDRLRRFLEARHSRGFTIVEDGPHHYFRGEYRPAAAKEVMKWLRQQGVVFPRKSV